MATRRKTLILIALGLALGADFGRQAAAQEGRKEPTNSSRSAPSAPEPKSLLFNGEFEATEGGGMQGWTRAVWPKGEGVERGVSVSGERAHSGGRSLRIDTQPVLGEEVSLIFNGTVSRETVGMAGRTLVLTGWVYLEPGTAARPMQMVLRAFGKGPKGESAFLGAAFEGKVLGRPGEWRPFRFSGALPNGAITQVDLHCGIHADAVRTVQFLDGLRLEPLVPPALELRVLRDALWNDERVLPVAVRLNAGRKADEVLTFRLADERQQAMKTWERKPKSGVVGLELDKRPLPEGRYTLRVELGNGKTVAASAEGSLQIAESPWAAAPVGSAAKLSYSSSGEVPEGFRVLGSTAPTTATDALPETPEDESADVDLGPANSRGYAVFARHYLDSVSRLGRPRPGEEGPVRLFACAGEYEPAAVSVWALRPQTAVQVKVSDLVGDSGVLNSTNIDVRVVRTIRGLPSFLEKRQTVDIPGGRTQTFWLTVRVPPDAKAGFYRGALEVVPRGGEPTRCEVLLRVLPIQLPPPQKGYGFWWAMDRRWDGYYSKERETALEMIRKQFVLLREHNCNMVSCQTMPKLTRADDGMIRYDFEQDLWGHNPYSPADFIRLGRETKFLSPRVPIQYPGADSLHSDWIARSFKLDKDDPAFDAYYREACRRVSQWAGEQGYTLAFACVDEIGNSAERRTAALRFYADAKEAGVLTSVTDNSMHAGMFLMGQPRFDRLITMRLFNFITPEMLEQTRRSGGVLWLYNLAGEGRNPLRERFVFGLFTERCGAEGCAQWAFQWPKGNASPYAAAASGSSGYHYALPAPDGPLPTVSLEGVREGIDDARYLALLPAEAREAFLKDLEPLSTAIAEQLENHSGSRLDARRWRIAKEALRAKAGLR